MMELVSMETRHRIAPFLRFLISGGLAAMIYTGATLILHSILGRSLLFSGVVAYAVSMPCAYLLHRHYSFSSLQPVATELPKFITQSVSGIVLCGAIPELLTRLGASLAFAMACTLVAVPLLNYMILLCWVFKTNRSPSSSHGASRP